MGTARGPPSNESNSSMVLSSTVTKEEMVLAEEDSGADLACMARSCCCAALRRDAMLTNGFLFWFSRHIPFPLEMGKLSQVNLGPGDAGGERADLRFLFPLEC